jgi:diguanylate cyclase (GGDEF)-like protein
MLERLRTHTRITLLATGCSLPAGLIAMYVGYGEAPAIRYAMLGLGAIWILVILLAWVGAERLVLEPIRAMLEMTRHVRAGDLSARTGMKSTHEELSQLGAALDEMAEQLQKRQRELQQALADLTEQATTDALTGLYNRRFFRDALNREIASANRKGFPFSVILLDIDHFKRVNDAFGHDAGDVVLKEIAAVLRASVRDSDIAVRHGGEEFAILLPETAVDVAAERAERLRQRLEQHQITYGTKALRITASFGVVQNRPGDADASALMKAVDAAMYSAKASGRNKVVVSQSCEVAAQAALA